MRRLLVVLTLGFLSAPAAELQAQQISFNGCYLSLSCHALTLDRTILVDPHLGPFAFWTGTARNWFYGGDMGYAQYIFTPAVCCDHGGYSWGHFTRETFSFAQPLDWSPGAAGATVTRFAGPVPIPEYHYLVPLTLTPEPATALLLLTGLGALGAGARRRRLARAGHIPK